MTEPASPIPKPPNKPHSTAATMAYPGEPNRSWGFNIPDKLGSYRIIRELGRGGMGIVFEAHDDTLERRVALKVLGPWLVGRPNAEARLQAEARSLAKFEHKNVVQIYGAARAGDVFFFAMEFVEGEGLDVVVERGPLTPVKTMEMGMQMAEALATAHEARIIHRDFKPSNVMITRSGSVKVADFGLASSPDEERLTATDNVVGTALYIAPEQARGHHPIPAMDVYALGCVLFEMLAGKPPFESDSPLALAMKHIEEDPPNVRGLAAQVPAALGDLVMQCLSKDAAQRPTAGEVKTRLTDLHTDHTNFEKTLGPLRAMSPEMTCAEEQSFRSAWGALVFAGVVGLAAISEAASPDLLGRYLSETYTIMRKAVESAGGMLEKFFAACCVAVFVADEPRRAVANALQATENLHQHISDMGKRFSLSINLSIAMNVGDFSIGTVHDGTLYHLVAIGNTFNVASRVESISEAGKTICTDKITSLLPEEWKAIPYTTTTLKDGTGINVVELIRRQ